MIFDINLGNVSTWEDKMRLVLNKPIKSISEYDAIMRTFSDYLFAEGFMMTRAETQLDAYTSDDSVALADVKNILSDNQTNWQLELYDKNSRLITRDKFAV